eukprot:PhM_4_TR15938/c0_g1_i1/m.286/K12854/SNRNP200, BRR2; pre-mRNA-splicing helicase BRR2
MFTPKAIRAQVAYETLLGYLRRKYLPDAQGDALHDTAETILRVLYSNINETGAEKLRMREIGRELSQPGPVDATVYHELLGIAKDIADEFTEWIETGSHDDDANGTIEKEEVVYTFELDDGGEEGASDNDDDVDAKEDGAVRHAPELSSDYLSTRVAEQMSREGVKLDDDQLKAMEENLVTILGNENLDDTACEESLMTYFQMSHTDLIMDLLERRWEIVCVSSLGQATSEYERQQLLQRWRQARGLVVSDTSDQLVNLDSMIFQEGGMLMTNTTLKLPKGTEHFKRKGYDEIMIPPPDATSFTETESRMIEKTDLPSWAHDAFPGMTTFNRMQSRVFETAYRTVDNMLCCAPTGAGKTNVAMLTIMGVIDTHIKDVTTKEVDTSAFKIVYIAPMKALVQEVVEAFRRRLGYLGITVDELSGDKNLSRQQLAATQIIVTTPEKWNVVTGKVADGDTSYTHKVSLVIIDEVHLLHNERGSVLESVVARILRQIERRGENVRLVGLSATLPNYRDVARFLRVEDRHVFWFDGRFRPVPLTQRYIGISEKKPAKREALMNEVLYEKVIEQVAKQQVLIFVHSRKETAKIARWLYTTAKERETADRIRLDSEATRSFFKEQSKMADNSDLKALLELGIGIHHAGLNKKDRAFVEGLFRERKIQILVSTATLAWGVNLPAHSVFIRGTKVYSEGDWRPLSGLDVMQMFGRAGRPGFDLQGEAYILTTKPELQYYLTLLNEQLPIESQFMSRLVDFLNAEIVNESVTSVEEAATWLEYTYWFVRSRQNPLLYKASSVEDDPTLKKHRENIIRSALRTLENNGLITYNHIGGIVSATSLGRVAAHYAVSHKSVTAYNQLLKPTMSYIDLFRLFAASDECQKLYVRMDEKSEIAKLKQSVPIPIREAEDTSAAKVNVLLQAYISRVGLDGFCLLSDMSQVSQSATRIMRALHQMALTRRWASAAEALLDIARMSERRLWSTQLPLRQLDTTGVSDATMRRLEGRRVPWVRFCEMTERDVAELCNNNQREAATLHRLIHSLPRLDVQVEHKPVSRSLLQVDCYITPTFSYNEAICGPVGEPYTLVVVDCDNHHILHQEPFMLRRVNAEREHRLRFFVEVLDPIPPMYYVKLWSERWIGCDTSTPILLQDMHVPTPFPALSELPDLCVSKSDVCAQLPAEMQGMASPVFEGVEMFAPLQSHLSRTLMTESESVLITAPSGSGKSVCAEMAVLRMMHEHRASSQHQLCLYLASRKEQVDAQERAWTDKFTEAQVSVVRLTGDVVKDSVAVKGANIIMATPDEWEKLAMQWKKKGSVVPNVRLMIVDHLHNIAGRHGVALEWAVSRMRRIALLLNTHVRIIGLGCSIANASDLAQWLGVPDTHVVNHGRAARLSTLDIHVHEQHTPGFHDRLVCAARPAYQLALRAKAKDLNTLVLVPTKRYVTLFYQQILECLLLDNQGAVFLRADEAQLRGEIEGIITDQAEAIAVQHGVGVCHETQDADAFNAMKALFSANIISVLVVPIDMVYSLDVRADVVVLAGTQHPETPLNDTKHYDVDEVLEAVAKCQVFDGAAVHVFTHTSYATYWRRMLLDPTPVESHLDYFLHDVLIRDIAAKFVPDMNAFVAQLSSTFLYRRLCSNPNYYKCPTDSEVHRMDYLSSLADNVMKSLEEAQLISVDAATSKISVRPMCATAAFHGLKCDTIEALNSVGPGATTCDALYAIVTAAEFADLLTLDFQEEHDLSRILRHCKYPLPDGWSMADPHSKALVLMQAYLSRRPLSAKLDFDMMRVVPVALQVAQALVDVALTHQRFDTSLCAMTLCQMIVQCMWDSDSPLLQLPYMTAEAAVRCGTEENIATIHKLCQLSEDQRRSALSAVLPELSPEKGARMLRFVEARYPIFTTFAIVKGENPKREVPRGTKCELDVKITRMPIPGGAQESETAVHCPYLPVSATAGHRQEMWWVVVANVTTNEVLSVRRLVRPEPGKECVERIVVSVPADADYGDVTWKVRLVSDSYLGCDVEDAIQIDIIAPPLA